MKPREKSLNDWTERQLKHLEKKLPLVWEKRHGSAYQVRGKADFMVLMCGVHGELELKAPGRHPNAAQRRWLDKCCQAGAIIKVAWNQADVIEWLNDLLEVCQHRCALILPTWKIDVRLQLVKSGSGWKIEVQYPQY